MTFVPSIYQQAYFDFLENGVGSCLIEAVAGSGKTTTILQGLKYLSGTTVFFAFNKVIVEDIVKRLPDFQPHRAEAKTLHGYGYKALRYAFGKSFELKIDEGKTKAILEAWAGKNAERIEWLEDKVSAMCQIVSMAKQRGIGALCELDDLGAWQDMIAHFGLDDNLPEDVNIDRVAKFCMAILDKSNKNLDVIDFDDMIYLPIQRNLRTFKFDNVLIDEAQDTNPVRRALAAKALNRGGRLIAVGDSFQAINGFTGADNDAMATIAKTFSAKLLKLSVSYRCPVAVVEHAKSLVPHIEPSSTAAQGEVSYSVYGQMFEQAKPGDAILCRKNAPMVSACFKFIRMGVPAKIEGKAIGEGLISISKRWKVSSLDAFEVRVTSWSNNQVAKAKAKKEDAKAERFLDQLATFSVLIERTRAKGLHTVSDLRNTIEAIFSDDVTAKDCVLMCSVHRSKGLEWNKVFLLGRSQFMPSKAARKDWQIQQENNLIYVAITRAKAHLVEVSGVPE